VGHKFEFWSSWSFSHPVTAYKHEFNSLCSANIRNSRTQINIVGNMLWLRTVSLLKKKCVAGRIAQLVFWKSWVRVMVRQFQSGFRSGFSTDTCLIHLTDCIKFEMDKGSIAWYFEIYKGQLIQLIILYCTWRSSFSSSSWTFKHLPYAMTFLHGLSLISAAGGCGWYSFYYCFEYLCGVHFRSSFMSNIHVCQSHVCNPKQ
jgi:hypothetical protein